VGDWLREHITRGVRFAAEERAEQGVDAGDEAPWAAWYMPSRNRAMNSCCPAAIGATIHSSGSLTTNSIVRPVGSDAIRATTLKVGAAFAVIVVGPLYAPFEARMTAAASAA
jgi:hypothetical protein